MIVALSTSTPVTSVALGRGEVMAAAVLRRPHAHAEFAAPALQFLMESAGCDVSHLTGVAVDRGPGLFTGLRVGLATAKGLALAAGVPITVFTSLDLMAFAARHVRHLICPVIDARRDEVFWGLYRAVPGGVEQVEGPAVSSPEAVAAELIARAEEVLLVGDGARTYEPAFGHLDHVAFAGPELAYPAAETALELAVERFAREEFTPPAEAHPLYLRRSDAEIKWEGRRERERRT
ncbi:MAG: tRNA (adenosine(37)-N6)-threonylcarbamoyltransferase complex dimerization subunit type 1 TsaB [Acidimicrobiia bacterium]|nr:tRNA (adenosine(37)-N6)-threonylcarbamoyltransferase complex dimerization subunit type 1 TsaB [Acidimicrobiia bacterium]